MGLRLTALLVAAPRPGRDSSRTHTLHIAPSAYGDIAMLSSSTRERRQSVTR